MKKVFGLIALVSLMALVSCGEQAVETVENTADTTATEQAVETVENAADATVTTTEQAVETTTTTVEEVPADLPTVEVTEEAAQ